jgi:hypothetical protein
MWKDEIVEEVRRIRDAQAAKFNYDIDAIVADARKRQQASGRKTVSFPPRKPVMSRAKKPVVEKA